MNELIQIVKILNEDELEIINQYVEGLIFSKTTVFDPNGTLRSDDSVRSNLGSCMDEEHEATKLLHERINSSLIVYRDKIIPINNMFGSYPVPVGNNTTCHREAIQISQYSPGQEYTFHHDTASNPNSKEYHRQISIVLYLNDNFDGGGTEFPHKIYKPSPGHGLIFPSNWCFPHSGQKVLSGTKRVAVTWYYVQDVRG